MTHCDECTMKPYCVARLNDNTVTGCNILLVHRGLISKEEFATEHTGKGGDGMNGFYIGVSAAALITFALLWITRR